MKLLSTAIALAMLGCVAENKVYAASEQHTTGAQIKHIDARTLKELLASDDRFTLVDARTDPYFDNKVIQGAIRVPMDSSDTAIASALPNKEKPIVVYCASTSCPASRTLAEKLVGLGYSDVTEFPEGLKGWEAAGYSTGKL